MNPSLLLISGWAQSITSLQGINKQLRHRFNTIFLEGHRAIQQKRLPDCDYIIATSMGALAALDKIPSPCKKIIILSGTACFCKKKNYECGVEVRILKRMQKQLTQQRQDVLNAFFINANAPFPTSISDSEQSTKDLQIGLEYMIYTDLRERIKKIKIPVLIIHGNADIIIPVAAAEWLHRHLLKSHLHILDGVGHDIIIHALDEIMKPVNLFLEQNI